VQRKTSVQSPKSRSVSPGGAGRLRPHGSPHGGEDVVIATSTLQHSWMRAESELSEHSGAKSHLLSKAMIMGTVLIAFPVICRFGHLSSASRCALVIVSMLMINLWEVMQLYCTALLIPVLGTLFGVLGESRSIVETSTLLVGNIFNNTSFMVLGALVINGIFTKCGLDRRFMALLLDNFLISGSTFLLMMMLGGCLMCSVLYSGSLVLLAALQPVLREGLRSGVLTPYDCKRILLGVAFCSNAGSALLPISSPVNLISISLLGDFDYKISLDAWVCIAMPVMMILMTITWAFLQLIYHSRGGGLSRDEAWEKQKRMLPREHVQLTDWHLIFMGVGLLAVLGITIYATQLEPIIGHSACLSLGVVVIVFGSGFMTKEEFNNLDWDILALVGGTNVMAFLVRETGMGMKLSDQLVELKFVEQTPYELLLLIALVGTVCTSGLCGHTITGVLLIPLVVAVGIKLHAAEETTILLAMAIPCGMHFAHSSFDNVLAQDSSRTLGRKSAELRAKDFRMGGLPVSASAVVLISTLGYKISTYFFEATPKGNRHETPDKLMPRVARENANAMMMLIDVGHAKANASTPTWESWLERAATWARSGPRRKLRSEPRQQHFRASTP